MVKSSRYCVICSKENIKKYAKFGFELKKPLYCSKHSKDENGKFLKNVCDVCHKKCIICSKIYINLCDMKRAIYGSGKIRSYCKEHKLKSDENLDKGKICEFEGCRKVVSYGFEKSKMTRCKQHMLDGQKYFRSNICSHTNCNTIASFYTLTNSFKIFFCSYHKPELSILNSKNKLCIVCKEIRATWGKKNGQKLYCAGCSKKFPKQDLIDLNSVFCKKCKLWKVSGEPYLCSYCKSDSISRQKTKEMKVVNFFRDKNICFDHNKSIGKNYGYYKPDLLFQYSTHNIIIEVDENQHQGYNKICERGREHNIYLCFNKPVIFLRFNVDKFSINNIIQKVLFVKRLDKLYERFVYHSKNIPNEELTIEFLFYNDYSELNKNPQYLTSEYLQKYNKNEMNTNIGKKIIKEKLKIININKKTPKNTILKNFINNKICEEKACELLNIRKEEFEIIVKNFRKIDLENSVNLREQLHKMEQLKVVKIDPNNPIFSNEIDKIFLQFVLKEKTRKEILEYDQELKEKYSREELKKIFGCSRISDKIKKFKKALNLEERQNNLIREYVNDNISIKQAVSLSNLSKDRIQVLARKMRNKKLAVHQPKKINNDEGIDINTQLEKGKKYSKKFLIECMINGKITPREIIKNENTKMKLRSVQNWLCNEKKKRNNNISNTKIIKNQNNIEIDQKIKYQSPNIFLKTDKKKKYDSGELPIPPKNPKPSDIPLETLSEICKLKAMNDCGKGGLGRKELMKKFNIRAKDTIRKIIKIRQKKHYDYWLNKFLN